MSDRISPRNEGLVKLRELVRQMGSLRGNQMVPLVLVSGFSGWGEALFGTFNYWGGFEDLPTVLQNVGYTVIRVRIGPLSSNWERACEVYAQLTSPSGFDEVDTDPPNPTDLIDVDYGSKYPARYGYEPTSKIRKAVKYGNLPPSWKWSRANPVHFITHSQGGCTVRYLLQLMTGSYPDTHPIYFADPNRQSWTKSLVTLGTPHRGTTITDVVKNLMPPNTLQILTQFITSASFKTQRFYDLRLDHHGFKRLDGETFLDMESRITPLVRTWWEGLDGYDPQNGFFDCSIEGMAKLNRFTATVSQETYFFSLSFDATIDFPEERATAEDLSTFPTIFSGSTILSPISNVGSWFGARLSNLGSNLGLTPRFFLVARWFTSVLNRHLGAHGYFNKIPLPGLKVPRNDMLPILLVTAVGMGGWEGRVADGFTAADFQPNDGIVNTISMRGPDERFIRDNNFPVQVLQDVGRLSEAKGKFWHLGVNKTMDHGDEIGVFTVGDTYLEVKTMYLLLAQLLSRLP